MGVFQWLCRSYVCSFFSVTSVILSAISICLLFFVSFLSSCFVVVVVIVSRLHVDNQEKTKELK